MHRKLHPTHSPSPLSPLLPPPLLLQQYPPNLLSFPLPWPPMLLVKL
jgi:hypothetical protein